MSWTAGRGVFNAPNPVFERGIEEIFGGDPRALVERYFELVREMVTHHPPDIVAHLDRIKKRNVNGKYWNEHAAWFVAEVDRTLDAVAGAGCILEVNTRGIYKGEITHTYPTDWIVRKAMDRGIPLQVNSDAHDVGHITGAFPEVYGRLRAMGLASVTVFHEGRFIPQKLELPTNLNEIPKRVND